MRRPAKDDTPKARRAAAHKKGVDGWRELLKRQAEETSNVRGNVHLLPEPVPMGEGEDYRRRN